MLTTKLPEALLAWLEGEGEAARGAEIRPSEENSAAASETAATIGPRPCGRPVRVCQGRSGRPFPEQEAFERFWPMTGWLPLRTSQGPGTGRHR